LSANFEVPIGEILSYFRDKTTIVTALSWKGTGVRPRLRAAPGSLFAAAEGRERRARRCVALVALAAAGGGRAGCVRAGCRRSAYYEVSYRTS